MTRREWRDFILGAALLPVLYGVPILSIMLIAAHC